MPTGRLNQRAFYWTEARTWSVRLAGAVSIAGRCAASGKLQNFHGGEFHDTAHINPAQHEADPEAAREAAAVSGAEMPQLHRVASPPTLRALRRGESRPSARAGGRQGDEGR